VVAWLKDEGINRGLVKYHNVARLLLLTVKKEVILRLSASKMG